MKKAIITLFFILLLGATSRTQHVEPLIDATDDSIINHYLADTVNAGVAIRELIAKAKYDANNKDRSAALKKYQLALTLEPYAQDSAETLAFLHSQFSNLLFNAGSGDLAIKYAKSSEMYFRKANSKPDDRRYNMLGKIGSFYLSAGQYDSAQYYFNAALHEANAIGRYLWQSAAYNNMGILAYRQQHLPAALQNYRHALAILQLKTGADSLFICSIYDNIAELQFGQGDYTDALQLYDTIGGIQKAVNNYGGQIKVVGRRVNTLLAMNNLKDAFAALQLMEQYVQQWGFAKNSDFILSRALLWKKYYEKTNQWPMALQMQELITHVNDSVNASNRQWMNETLSALTRSEIGKFSNDIKLNRVQLALQQRELEVARSAARKNRVLIIMGIVLFVVLLAFGISRTNSQKNQLRLERAEKELMEKDLSFQTLQREKLEQELNYKKGDLSNLSIYLSNLQDIYDNLLEKLHEIKTKKPTEQKEEIAQIIKTMDAQIHSSEKQSMIQENVEQVNREFYDKLLKAFPDLTKSETELCGLLKLNMSNKEIGALKNISAESVKMARYRLRKKLGLAPEEDIYRFLANI